MIYLERFRFSMSEGVGDYRGDMTCFDTMYPFGILSRNEFTKADFEPITIFYGGNGSGKSTALNVIAEKLGLERDTLYNRSDFFEDYLKWCRYDTRMPVPAGSRIITSDDVFDYMLNLRMVNNGIDRRREELFGTYWDDQHAQFQLKSLDDYERLKQINLARSKTPSKYIRKRLMDNVREQSNGESASFYFISKIQDGALYLLDEPENSLSPLRQKELVEYIENQARFFDCQFIIATHSPFLLAMKGARVYDLDEKPVQVRPWTELPSVRTYYEFFREHWDAFSEK